ncbi:hypothetical protein EYR38_003275 [Pleurotus pulmonarius]|nr:hypothetical protein EYR38_003275 [Pleurotus pulmonarius]
MRDLLFLQEDCPKEFRWKPSQPEPMSSFGSDIVIKCVQGGRERTDVVARWSFLEELAKLAKYDKNGEAVIEFKRKFSFGEAFCRFRVKKSLPTPSPGNPNSTPGTVINNYIHNGDKFLGNMNGCIIAGRNNVNSISMGSIICLKRLKPGGLRTPFLSEPLLPFSRVLKWVAEDSLKIRPTALSTSLTVNSKTRESFLQRHQPIQTRHHISAPPPPPPLASRTTNRLLYKTDGTPRSKLTGLAIGTYLRPLIRYTMHIYPARSNLHHPRAASLATLSFLLYEALAVIDELDHGAHLLAALLHVQRADYRLFAATNLADPVHLLRLYRALQAPVNPARGHIQRPEEINLSSR